MRLLVVRHAKAEEKAEWSQTGQPDSSRPLTAEGKKEFRKAARGLQEIVNRIDLLLTSPLVRARETAEILAAEFRIDIEESSDLAAPMKHKNVMRWLQTQAKEGRDVVAIVGHEPDLSFFIGWLLSGEMKSFVELKKGGFVMLEFQGPVQEGEAQMSWYAPPALSKKIGSAR